MLSLVEAICQTGDLNGTTTLEFVAPSAVTALSWNGASTAVIKTTHGSFTTSLNGAKAIALPALANWKVSGRLVHTNPHRIFLTQMVVSQKSILHLMILLSSLLT